jgi:hypothetical protein
MAFTVTNHGKFYIMNNAITSSTDIRAAIFKGTPPSAATIQDYDFLSSLTGAMSEAAAAGYSRAALDLAGVAVAEDDTGNLAKITASAWTLTSVASGETWTAIGYFVYNASDSAAPLLGVDAPTSSLVTNGNNVTGPALEIDLT